MKRGLLSLVVFASCSLGAAQAQRPPRLDRAALTAEIAVRADQMADRLTLTPDQRRRAAPIIRTSLLRRWSALTSAWSDGALDDQERRRLISQFEIERRGVVAELDGFLSDEQVDTFRRLQAEETSRFHEELRQGRYSADPPDQ